MLVCQTASGPVRRREWVYHGVASLLAASPCHRHAALSDQIGDAHAVAVVAAAAAHREQVGHRAVVDIDHPASAVTVAVVHTDHALAHVD